MRKADRSLFGRWLETEINSRGMTQTEFAVASGVPVATLSRWMNDDGPFEIRGQNRQKLSDFLGVPVDVIDAQSGIIDRVMDERARVITNLAQRIDWSDDDWYENIRDQMQRLYNRQRQG